MRTKIRFLEVKILLFMVALALLTLLFSYLAYKGDTRSEPTLNEADRGFDAVILDAGHGGEDGGAVSPQGYFEKDINLSLCNELALLLRSNGIPVIQTRTKDILLYDRGVNYQGRKKALDLAARKKIAEENPSALFVSIHMNSYPLPQYRGLQVWYSPNHLLSQSVAGRVQGTVKDHLQPQNDRRIKAATSSIYLLHHLQTPAVLVECGFLSNSEEAELLKSEEYQKQLALLLMIAILENENPTQ